MEEKAFEVFGRRVWWHFANDDYRPGDRHLPSGNLRKAGRFYLYVGDHESHIEWSLGVADAIAAVTKSILDRRLRHGGSVLWRPSGSSPGIEA